MITDAMKIAAYPCLLAQEEPVCEGQGGVEDEVHGQVLPHQLVDAPLPPNQQLPEHTQPRAGGNLGQFIRGQTQ